MRHQVILNGIGAYSREPIAYSRIENTSNCVFTDWCVRTFLSIKDKKPYARFVVASEHFDGDTLFETDDYAELEKWIDEHMDEIQNQIDTKAEDWIKRYNNPFSSKYPLPEKMLDEMKDNK